MNEPDAVAAFERLGLTRYEALTFIGLHRLGSGSAREVADVVDVPRPQVYSTAVSLEERGLIDVQQSDPIRYRPVELEEARGILRDRFERSRETAFEYVERVRAEAPDAERREDVWTLAGREAIDARIRRLIGEAEREVVYGIHAAALLDGDALAALEAAADAADVEVISSDPAVAAAVEDVPGVAVVDPAIEDAGGATGRLLAVDADTVLLSVFGGDGTDSPTETALWSADTEFARVLVRLVESHLQR